MIEAIYINAMLSDAAYVDFLATHLNPETGEIEASAKELFTNLPDGNPKGRGWTEEQFEWFQNNFVAYKNANRDLAYQDNTPSGFPALPTSDSQEREECRAISGI